MTADQDIDLFCGAGGWGLGASALGLDPLGIEWDDDACATHNAAGFSTLQADVAALDPLDFGEVRGMIASPPCQAWSRAGNRLGIVDQEHVFAVAQAMLAGVDLRSRTLPRLADPRSLLVIEPLRWALALRPKWIALEQVPDVLPFWQFIEGALAARGYSAWCGKVNAADYGVAQTRERAVLLASRIKRVGRPAVTHADERRGLPMGYKPWVSMAQALGWGLSESPSGTIMSVSPNGGPRSGALDGGSGSRARYKREQDAGRWVFRNGNQENAAVRTMDEPAPTIAFGNNAAAVCWVELRRGGSRIAEGIDPNVEPAPTVTSRVDRWQGRRPRGLRAGTNANDVERSIDEPAATVRFGARLNTVEWQFDGDAPKPKAYNRRDQRDNRTGKPVRHISTSEPAPTISGESRNDSWVHDRPATTLQGDPRIAQPGHKRDAANPDAPGRMEGSVRVSLEEAAVLQSFPPDFPWQGNTQSSLFRQVGNAVPPLLALRMLEVVV